MYWFFKKENVYIYIYIYIYTFFRAGKQFLSLKSLYFSKDGRNEHNKYINYIEY